MQLIIKQRVYWRERRRSFGHAVNGLMEFLRSEAHARIHLFATLAAVALALWLGVSRSEATMLAFAIALVWIAEMINTAIEKAMDFITLERHPQIRTVKDIAAGAVLVAAITALFTGAFIFLPKILS